MTWHTLLELHYRESAEVWYVDQRDDATYRVRRVSVASEPHRQLAISHFASSAAAVAHAITSLGYGEIVRPRRPAIRWRIEDA